MTVKELNKCLEKLIKEGYGDFIAVNDGYYNEIEEKDIMVSNGEVLI